jgi:Poly(A) polymerase catalytic subunit
MGKIIPYKNLMEEIERISQIASKDIDKKNASDPEVKKLLGIVHHFLQTHRLLCYGGTAINNILPKKDRFYDMKYDIPDYDFFSEIPQIHAMKLADRIKNAGYKSVEVKPGSHLGTFKVFANYIGIADITFLSPQLFKKLWDKKIEKEAVSYVPPNFLRMSIYLELSRPKGDVSRWTKVYERLLLLNKHYPISSTCPKSEIAVLDAETKSAIQRIIIDKKAVLLGFTGAAIHEKHQLWEYPIDILCDGDKRKDIVEKIHSIVSGNVKEHGAYAEVIPAHTDITKDGNVVVRVFETTACHSFHTTPSGLRLASIPTLLQFFFAMLYGDHYTREVLAEDRLLCVAQHLVDMANGDVKRRYKLLTPIECIGHQESLVDIKKEKAELYSHLSSNKSSRNYLKYFFSYTPTETSKTRRLKIRERLRKTLKNR